MSTTSLQARIQTAGRNLYLRLALVVTLALTASAVFQFFRLAEAAGIPTLSRRFQLLFAGGMAAGALGLLVEAGLLAAALSARREAVWRLLETGFERLRRLGQLNLTLFALGIAGFAFLLLGPPARFLEGTTLHLLPWWLLVVGGTILLRAAGLGRGWGESAVLALLVSAAGFKLAAYLPEVSTHPFSLGWSEASRYYYASLYFAERLYGGEVPLTVLHPTRYLMQAVPFLIPHAPIWLHRLWQVLLWLATTLAAAGLLARRLSRPSESPLRRDPTWRRMFVLWAALFLLMAPVYYHLLVTVILVLAGFDRRRLWRTTAIVLLASAWAGISRVNWFPVPGLLAAALYLLEETPGGRPIWRYLLPPAAWFVLGSLAAFASQSAYALLSGNPPDQFSSSFSSDLLWYRLFPNPTYPLGILPSVLLVIAPLLLLMRERLRGSWRGYHPLRLLGLGGALLALFAGGLVVSVKIGGGSNLHNLDAFLVLLLLIAGYIFFGQFEVESNREMGTGPVQARPSQAQPPFGWVAGLALLLPVVFTIGVYPARTLPGPAPTAEALETIQAAIDEAARQGGEVLFISERQLLFFEDVRGAKLVPDYEKVFLMEMAMANNPIYLETFTDDLRSHRFALIVSEPLKVQFQGRASSFGEENDAWVRRVVKPILCYYEPAETLKPVRTQLLVPKTEAGDCQ